MFPEIHKSLEGLWLGSYQLVDWVVLAAIKLLLEVQHPEGRAGVDAVVVEHAVHGHVLSWSCDHPLRDVAHSCTCNKAS